MKTRSIRATVGQAGTSKYEETLNMHSYRNLYLTFICSGLFAVTTFAQTAPIPVCDGGCLDKLCSSLTRTADTAFQRADKQRLDCIRLADREGQKCDRIRSQIDQVNQQIDQYKASDRASVLIEGRRDYRERLEGRHSGCKKSRMEKIDNCNETLAGLNAQSDIARTQATNGCNRAIDCAAAH